MPDAQPDVSPTAPPRRRWRLRTSIATVLMVGFGGLTFLGIGGALSVAMWSASENTMALLADKAELGIGALAGELRRHLDSVRDGNVYLARLIAEGEVDPGDRMQLSDYMRGAMAATPQVLGMAYVSPGLEVMRISRAADRFGIRIANERDDPALKSIMADARTRSRPYWGELLWAEHAGATLVNLRAPLRRNGKFLGVLVSAVTVSELSRFLAKAPVDSDVADRFILYGRDHVLAHRSMSGGKFPRSTSQPLPRLDQVGDPVLARMWRADARSGLTMTLKGETKGHVIHVDDKFYPVVYRQVAGYGAVPLTVGAYIPPGAGRGEELRRLALAGGIGAAILFVSLFVVLFLGRRMSRPVRDLALAAGAVGKLDLARVPPVPPSRYRELDDAATAFNGMIAALRWFEIYVPRKLVQRLVVHGDASAVESQERQVTVMFTDIAAFTPLAERLGAAGTARLLNEHFALLAGCIEAEDGTVDKFIGDSVMAFWGPPLGDDDHVARACRAALAIRAAVAEDNRARANRGEAPLRVRIGIHTGPAIVGNIGAPGRINYTLVGDTVNIAQRLEELGKTLTGGAADATIVISADVARAVDGDHAPRALGLQDIRGREGGLEVFSLD